MLTPFLKYVSEAKVIRRHSDLGRFTFYDVTERIYLSFLALALMSQRNDSKSFAKSYANQTMQKGTFDQVRMVNNDLANMLAIVAGDPEITKKLQNKNNIKKIKFRYPVLIIAITKSLGIYAGHPNVPRHLGPALGLGEARCSNFRLAMAYCIS